MRINTSKKINEQENCLDRKISVFSPLKSVRFCPKEPVIQELPDILKLLYVIRFVILN